MRTRLIIAVLCCLACAAPAYGATFLPPDGRVFHGVAGSNTVDLFAGQTGKPPAAATRSCTGSTA